MHNKYKRQIGLINNLMKKQKEGNNYEDINYSYEGGKEKDHKTYLRKYNEYSLKETIEKYINKELSKIK